MVNTISVKSILNSKEAKYISLPFYHNGKPLENHACEDSPHACWGMTLLKAGTMRFRWNENNENRTSTLKEIFPEHKITPVELIHSKIVVEAKSESDTKNLQADGIVTKNPLLVPTITIADCVPIFLYDKKTKSFGAFHSGWKGTGIAKKGVEKMAELYGSKPENISAAIGPHIGNCCYFVDRERAEYFSENFGEECIERAPEKNPNFPYTLSLTKANLHVLKSAGIAEENIVVADDCTCCTTFSSGGNIFGSFRRQAAFLPSEISNDERSRSMTVQAGFVWLP